MFIVYPWHCSVWAMGCVLCLIWKKTDCITTLPHCIFSAFFQLNDLICCEELNVESEEQVFTSVLNWIQNNLEERRCHIPEVGNLPGPCLNIETFFPGIGIPIIKIRRLSDRLIFAMGSPIPVRRYLYIEQSPGVLAAYMNSFAPGRGDNNFKSIILKTYYRE